MVDPAPQIKGLTMAGGVRVLDQTHVPACPCATKAPALPLPQRLARTLGAALEPSRWASSCRDCLRAIPVGEPVAWAAGAAACAGCAPTLRPAGAGPWQVVPAAFPGGRCAGCRVEFRLGQPIHWASRTRCLPCAARGLLGAPAGDRSAGTSAVHALLWCCALGREISPEILRDAARALENATKTKA